MKQKLYDHFYIEKTRHCLNDSRAFHYHPNCNVEVMYYGWMFSGEKTLQNVVNTKNKETVEKKQV